MIKDTSISAYRELVETGSLQKQEYELVNTLYYLVKPVSRVQLSNLSGMPINAVAGRVNGLIKKNIVEELRKSPCPVTGRMVYKLQLKELA